MKVKYLILGAGPAGLTIANKLKQMGERSFRVVEREKEAGGLCRSREVDGSAFDIGGGHFLDVKRKEVNQFLFQFMPEKEWNIFTRDSRIVVNGNEVAHPIESNIWQMKIADQVDYLKSVAAAGCNRGEEMPTEFVKWIYWKLGQRIAEDYMIPYNQKLFQRELEELGTYWLEKLPNVSFEETLFSCLEKRAYGTQPGHAKFYYPKEYGYGELWLRMGAELGNQIEYNESVTSIDFDTRKVQTESGKEYWADTIITTIPWTSIRKIEGMPQSIRYLVKKLKYSSIETRYFEDTLHTKAHWLYYPDPKLAYHRILVRSNFCMNSKGYWTETNSQRVCMMKDTDKGRFHYKNEYAYPLNTMDKPGIMNQLLAWCTQRKIIGLGRWGEWQHYNSDVTVARALELAAKLEKGK